MISFITTTSDIAKTEKYYKMKPRQSNIDREKETTEEYTPVDLATLRHHQDEMIKNFTKLEPPVYKPFGLVDSVNGEVSEDVALAIVLSLSSSETNPEKLCTIYVDKLQQGDITSAENFYSDVVDEVKFLIDAFLDTVPWRISTEYRYDGTTIHWTNSCVKIGWFPPNTFETSPALYKGTWTDNTNDHGIHFTEFKAAVWEGLNSTMIHRLLSNGSQVNIKLTFDPNYGLYIISDVAFHGFDKATEELDLATVDIGSLSPSTTPTNFDDLRIHQTTITNSDGTTHKLFNGTTLGLYLVTDSDIYSIDEDTLIDCFNDVLEITDEEF